MLGPKRLPGLVSKVGRWVGKARSMARDFQQQLETEVNLEELNRMTEMQTRNAQQSMPPPPPGLNGEPLPESTESPPTYPYSAAEVSPTPEPAATDDTFSHAHAEGAEPMPYEAPAAEPAVAEVEPTQADLDLSTPDDDSHLPPDDARRYS